MFDRIARGLRRAAAQLDARFLPAVPASRPAAMRLVNGIYTSVYLGRRMKLYRQVHRTDPDMFRPVGPVKVLTEPLPPSVADGLFYANLVTTGLTTLGFAHKVTGPVHAALSIWTMSYRNSWSMILHDQVNALLHTAVLGITPAADAVSVDALLRKKLYTPPPTGGVHSWLYSLPIRGMQLTTATHYFLSGVAKLCGPMGLAWGGGEVLRRQIMADGMRKELLGTKATNLGVQLTRTPLFFTVAATGSLVLELVAPFVLVDKRAARAWAVSAWSMHVGIYLIMGIRFRHNLSGVLYQPYLDMEKALPPSWR